MRLRAVPVPRWPKHPRWAAALAAALALLVLGGVAVERRTSLALDTCLFHRITGHPCPTCGSTRAVLALASGQWGSAFHFNPLVSAVLLLGLAQLLVRLATGRQLALEASAAERQGMLATGLVALALNWAWVLRTLA